MSPSTSDRFAPDVDRRMALAREWDELVAQVRELPGFADFLRPPQVEALLPAAAGGPVVIVNVSRWRCDALIVRTSGVEVVELPDLTRETVAEKVREYLDAVGARQADALRGATRDLRPARPVDGVEKRLDACLTWMWHSFAGPILDRLGFTGAPEGPWPRIWWCPTGPLTLLPIHAAGDHRTPGAAVLDRVISSYTPTLRALLEARAAPAAPAQPGRMLFVGMPTTPEPPGRPDVVLSDLPNVAVERDLLARLFAERCTTRIGPDAVRRGILDDLRQHSWVHFACHGEQNLDDPSRGGVLVHDGALTVTDLSSQQYRGDFAYLSGCKTAVGGRNLPDEAITLAAALHYTGYRHVIATLWSVFDEQAAQVAEDVYTDLVHDGDLRADDAAAALHRAVRRLRAEFRHRPSVWTPFAHTGP